MSDYDNFYRNNKFFRGKTANDLTQRILNFKTKGKVIDFGCGEGQDLLFLKNAGFSVFGIDKSMEAIINLKELSKEFELDIEVEQSEFLSYKFKEKYDVILAEASLHFIPYEQRKELVNRLKENTENDGLNVIGIFDERTDTELHSGMKYWNIDLFKENELVNYYSDWKILEYKEYKVKIDDRYYRSITQLIAQKNKI